MFRVQRVCITHGIVREYCPVVGNEKVKKDHIVIWRMEYELFDIDFHPPLRERFCSQSSLTHVA